MPNLQDVRHFTQMVWSETKSMGLGMATGFDGKIYFVCNYDPPGNVDGQFASNVSSSLTGVSSLIFNEVQSRNSDRSKSSGPNFRAFIRNCRR